LNVDSVAQAYDRLLERFIVWAQAQDDLRAALLIGSRARPVDHPADEFADLDIILVCTSPQRYLEHAGWVEALGDPWLTFIEVTGDGSSRERRVLFTGGLDVDFAFLPLTFVQESDLKNPPPVFMDIVRRGARLLLDKDALFKNLPTVADAWQPPAPPSQAEFTQVVNDFWYHAMWSAKHLRRGELWWAKGGIDDRLKYLLLRMLEWHAQALRGPSHDTWLRGRFLEEWADPRAVSDLRQCFAHYDPDDLWRALFATMRLFRWLMEETAEQLYLGYAQTGIDHTAALVQQLYDDR
jgi:aminoglycoside 6-adenylyltransferase